MDIYKTSPIASLLSGNPYPGRGIMIGMTPDGKKPRSPISSWAAARTAATAYSSRKVLI